MNRPHDRSIGFLGRTALVVLVAAAAFLAWKAASVLLLVFFGILLGVLLATFTGWIARATPLGWRPSLGVVLLLLALVLGGFGWLVGPRLASQAQDFRQQLSSSAQDLERRLSRSEWGRTLLQRAPGLEAAASEAAGGGAGARDAGGGTDAPGPQETGTQRTSETGETGAAGVQEMGETGETGAASAGGAAGSSAGGGSLAGSAASVVWNVLTGVAQALGDVILVVFIGIFLAADPRLYQRGIAQLLPRHRRERTREVLAELGRTIQAWLLVQLVSMTTVAILVWIGLSIIGVQPALVLAALAFLLEFIPFIGPWLAFVPAALIALTMGGSTLLWVTALYFLANVIEGEILLPLLQQRAVDVPPALTLGGIFLLGALFGFAGILVAAPLVAVIYVFVKLVYVEDALHESVPTPRGT